MHSKKSLTRRGFLGGLAGGVAGSFVGGAGLLTTGCSSNIAAPASAKDEATTEPKSPSTVRFGVIADPHFDVVHGNDQGFKLCVRSPEIVQACVAEMNKRELDLVILPGDLLRDGEPTNLDLLRELLEELDAPYRVIFGNHDYALPRKSDISKASFARAFAGRGFGPTEYYYADNVNGWRFLYLDTSRIGRVEGFLNKRELAWVEDQIATSPHPIVIVLHHAAIPYSDADAHEDWDLFRLVEPDRSAFLGLVHDNPKVKLVLHGHHHMGAVKVEDGVIHYSCHAVCSYPCRFGIFELRADSLRWETFPVPVENIVEEGRQLILDGTFSLPTKPDDKDALLEVLRGDTLANGGQLPLRKD